jgi:MFS transporter, DHA2 family, multidrug resistance protein
VNAQPPGQPISPGIAWRGLAATGIGALLAGLSAQAHGLAQTDLGGALGHSADEASWVVTAGTAAEGAAVLITAPLVAAFGIRRVMTAALIATGGLAVLVRQSTRLDLDVALRFLQGFAAGLLPVAMMAWALRAFPPERRGLPLMLFAFASSVPSGCAALVAGTMTDHLGGRGVFAFDMLWTPVVLIAARALTPREPIQVGHLLAVDWVGYLLLATGVMLLLVLLSQGERRYWLETAWMAPLAAGSVACLALALAWLLAARAPLLDLTLLLRPTFALGLSEAFSLRFALLMASFAVPQALARLHGFRAEQAGLAILWLAAGHAVGFPAAYLWIRWRDARWTLAIGLALFAAGALAAALIDPNWEGDQFRLCLVLAGLGQGCYLTSVMTFATYGVPASAGATASGLFNLTRVLGTAGATAAVGYGLRIRENFHSARLVESVTVANPAAAARYAELTAAYTSITPDAGAARTGAIEVIAGDLTGQAYVLAFADVFIAIAIILAAFALLVPLLPRLPAFSASERP